MRARDILLEQDIFYPKGNSEFSKQAADDTTEFIFDYCLDFVKESRVKPLYRGIDPEGSAGPLGHVNVFTAKVRTNRKPRDTSSLLHNALNKLIQDKGLVANRGNSIFCTSDVDQAHAYGEVFAVFPIGKFYYTWSPSWRDATNNIDEAKYLSPSQEGYGKYWELYKTWREDNIKHYEEDLKSALQTGDKTKIQYAKLVKNNFDSLYSLDDKGFKLYFDEYHRNKIEECYNFDYEKFKKDHYGSLRGDDGSLIQAITMQHEVMIHAQKVLYVYYDFYHRFLKYKLFEKFKKDQ